MLRRTQSADQGGKVPSRGGPVELTPEQYRKALMHAITGDLTQLGTSESIPLDRIPPGALAEKNRIGDRDHYVPTGSMSADLVTVEAFDHGGFIYARLTRQTEPDGFHAPEKSVSYRFMRSVNPEKFSRYDLQDLVPLPRQTYLQKTCWKADAFTYQVKE